MGGAECGAGVCDPGVDSGDLRQERDGAERSSFEVSAHRCLGDSKVGRWEMCGFVIESNV